MRAHLLSAIAILAVATFNPPARADVKNAPYPEIKVKLSKGYKPDAAFEKMRAAFAGAATKKDTAGLLALIGPTFVWTLNGEVVDKFDMGRDAAHNFKVVFGFRQYGKDVDGGVEDGPFWDALASFAADATYYQATDAGNLICGPMVAEIVDTDVFEQARKKIETGDSGADWYFTLSDVAVAKGAGRRGRTDRKARHCGGAGAGGISADAGRHANSSASTAAVRQARLDSSRGRTPARQQPVVLR